MTILPILYTVATLDAFAFVLVITTINPYVYSLEGTQFYLGVLGSLAAFINFLWNPIVGSLSDSLGRKTVLLQCMTIVAIGNLLSGLSSSLTIFFIARILTTFGTQIGALLKSLVDDNVPTKEAKMSAINKMQAFGGVCFIFGSLASGFLSELENGYRFIFYLITAIMIINFVLIYFIPDVQKVKNKPTKFNFFAEIQKAATNLSQIDWPKYWDLFAIKLITDFVLTVFNFNLTETLLKRFGITGKHFGYVFASVSIMGIITTLTMTKLKKYLYVNDDSGLKRLFHGCILLIYAYLGLGLSTIFASYYLHLIPVIIGRVLFESTFTEVILSRAGAQEKGSIMGTFESTLALAGFTAPVVSGIISDKWGSDKSMILCTIPLLFGAAVAYLQRKKNKLS